jgi:hypothetical protein
MSRPLAGAWGRGSGPDQRPARRAEEIGNDHLGGLWPPERREKFADRIRNWDTSWFISAVSGGKPSVWYMSDVFISRILAFIDEVIEAAGQHAREVYSRISEPAAQASSGSAASPATSSKFDTVTPISRIGFFAGKTLFA